MVRYANVWPRAGSLQGHKRVMMHKDVLVCYPKLEIEHVQKFALDPPNIALVEQPSAQGPMHVFQGGVVQVLQRDPGISFCPRVAHFQGMTNQHVLC